LRMQTSVSIATQKTSRAARSRVNGLDGMLAK